MARLGEVLPPDEQPGGPAISPDLRSSIWPSIHPAILELIRAASQHDRLHQQPAPERTPRPSTQRAGRRGAGPRPPRQHRPRAARVHRGGAQGRPDPGAGRDELGSSWASTWARSTSSSRSRSPTSVARGLQRVGRAGHQVGAPSKGIIFPKYRGDLLECAVVTRRMHEGAIEHTAIPRNPLDVLAQQLVAMTVMDRWTGDELLATVPARGALRVAHARGPRRRAGHARRRVPIGRVRRAQATGRVGPPDRHGGGSP